MLDSVTSQNEDPVPPSGRENFGDSVPAAPIRDQTYYYQDGSCTFLVEGYLFKIHRSILEGDSAFFKTMFSLPQSSTLDCPSGAEGSCDENPIICQDSAAGFKSLCWALYAKPIEIAAQMDPSKTNAPRMIRVAEMAVKYEFNDLREWALNCLEVACRGLPRMFSAFNARDNLERLLNLAHTCKKIDLALRIENTFLTSISQSPNNAKALVWALDSAERLNLRAFHGKAYHTYLKAIGKFNWRTDNDVSAMGIAKIASYVDKEPHAGLNETRKLRLYHGFWSLTQLRHHLDKAPLLDGNPQCPVHIIVCKVGWEQWWKDFLEEATAEGRHLNDPGELFQELQKRIMVRPLRATHPPHSTNQVPCHALIKAQVCAMKKQFDDTLANHFMIPME